MNKETKWIENPELTIARENITRAVTRSISDHFDVFTHILSSTIWQSPMELALKLIEELSPREWEILKDRTDDTLEVKREKEALRTGIMVTSSRIICYLGSNPGIVQRISTRLLVQEKLAQTLSNTDQDRVLAAELMLGYRNWKRLLSTITTHDIVNDERQLTDKPFGYTDESGRYTHTLVINGHIDPIETIAELPIIHTQTMNMLRIGPVGILVPFNVSQVLFDESVLMRHDNMIGSAKQEGKIRNMIFRGLGDTPVYKKRSLGNQKQEPELRTEWKPYGV